MRRLSDQQHRPRRSGGLPTRERSIQVSVETGAFLFALTGHPELSGASAPVGAREAGSAKAPGEQGSERTRTCVSDRRSLATPAQPEIVSAR